MVRMVKVRIASETGTEIKEVTVQEAERILDEAYDAGAVVADARTGEVIFHIGADVEELVITRILAGG